MSTTPPAPAGWYPDATNGNRMRYWDGTAWSDQFAAPVAAPAAQLTAPEGTDQNTPWIWLHLFVPLVPMIPLLFIDWSAFVTIDPANPDAMILRQMQVLTSPAYIATTLLGWVAYAATVLFAYLDFRTLRDRGVPKPFHWAFAFLSYSVYGIGRGVVAQRRTGKGIVVTWVAAGILVAGFLFGIIFSVVLVSAIFSQMPGLMTYN